MSEEISKIGQHMREKSINHPIKGGLISFFPRRKKTIKLKMPILKPLRSSTGSTDTDGLLIDEKCESTAEDTPYHEPRESHRDNHEPEA